MQNRIEYMDILKAYAIIFVVIGHSGSVIGRFLYLFHMPLFFIISGYFFKDDSVNTPFRYIFKRFKDLYIPFLKYEIVFLSCHNLFMYLNLYSDNLSIDNVSYVYSIKDYITNIKHILLFDGTESLLSPFWFLSVLFLVSILYLIITKYTKEKEYQRGLTILICFIIGNVMTKYNLFIIDSLYNPQGINVTFVALLMFYAGNKFRTYEGNIKIDSKFAFLSFLILILLRLYGTIDMRMNNYPDPTFLITGMFCGTYMMLYIAKLNYNRIVKNLLLFIGKNTLTIMALHVLAFKFIGIIQIKLYNLPIYLLGNWSTAKEMSNWWIAYSAAGIFFPLILICFRNIILSHKPKFLP